MKCSDVYGIIDCTAVPKESPPTTCICKEQWSIDDYENCGVTQNGCEPTACDGDTAPWCNIKNPGCDEEESGQGWAYCTPTLPQSWGCNLQVTEQYGGAVSAARQWAYCTPSWKVYFGPTDMIRTSARTSGTTTTTTTAPSSTGHHHYDRWGTIIGSTDMMT